MNKLAELITWKPTNNREREAIRKFGHEWMVSEGPWIKVRGPSMISIEPIGKPGEARWIFTDQILDRGVVTKASLKENVR